MEFHKFSNGVEVAVSDTEVKVYAGGDDKGVRELTHPDLSRRYIHSAVFFKLKRR